MIVVHRTSTCQYFLRNFNDFASPGQPSPAQPSQPSQPVSAIVELNNYSISTQINSIPSNLTKSQNQLNFCSAKQKRIK
jgi:hypothetical protein